MATPVLTLDNIHLTFGGHPLLEDASLSVSPGERICLVGRNGSGKSTLLKIAAGLVDPDSGERFLHPGTTIRYLPQEPDLSGFETTHTYVEAGLNPTDDPYRAAYLLEHLGLSGEENPGTLSGGEARRAALARVLAPTPDILLLDEPTNHLDLPAIEWLESELASLKSAMILISHDRRFLEALSKATIWLDRGTARRLEKGFHAFEEWRDKALEEEAIERHKLDRKIAREEDWLRYGVTARRKRNVRRLGELHALRDKRRNLRKPQGNVAITAEAGTTSGKKVLETEHLSKSFADRPIVRDLSIRIQRGDRLGIVGPNGAGKSTLIRLLTGALCPDTGTITRGAGVEMVTLDQRRESLDDNWTLLDALTGGDGGDTVVVNGKPRHVRSYMQDFLFEPIQARQPINRLSGGERGRLMLARALARSANLLVLDEPTNDLDLETLDLLQEILADYDGTVLLVSHDRDFLDRTATSILAFEGGGKWVEYAGGYSDMTAQRKAAGTELPEIAEAVRKASGKKVSRRKPETVGNASSPTFNQRKLTNKERHALDTLPNQMEKLESEIAKLETILGDPDFYNRDPGGFTRTSEALDTARNALAKAEERWLELEMLREELDRK